MILFLRKAVGAQGGRPLVSLGATVVLVMIAFLDVTAMSYAAGSTVRQIESESEMFGRADVAGILARLPAGRHVLNHGSYRITANTTIPAGVVLDILPGSSLAPVAGVTVTFRGSVEPTITAQIFTGSGKVVGLRFNRPEWWGAQRSYGYIQGRDDAPAISASIASALASTSQGGLPSEGERPKVSLSGYYYVCEQVDAYVNESTSLEIEGPGGTPQSGGLITCPTFIPTSYPKGASGGVLAFHGIAKGRGSITDINLHDLAINNIGVGAVAGIVFNPEGVGHSLSNALQEQTIRNIYVGGFNTGFVFLNARQFKIAQSSAWNGSSETDTLGVLVRAVGTNSFAGDLDFEDFQSVTCKGINASNCLRTGAMTLQATEAGAFVSGVRIQGIFYASNEGIKMVAAGGGSIIDVWIQAGSQFDGFYCRALGASAIGVDASSSHPSRIIDVHIAHVYHAGSLPCGPASHTFIASNGGIIEGVLDQDNWFSGLGGPAALFEGVSNGHFDGNAMTYGIKGKSAVWIRSGTRVMTVRDNTLIGGATIDTQFDSIIRMDEDTDYLSFGGNIGSGVAQGVIDKSNGKHNVVR